MPATRQSWSLLQAVLRAWGGYRLSLCGPRCLDQSRLRRISRPNRTGPQLWAGLHTSGARRRPDADQRLDKENRRYRTGLVAPTSEKRRGAPLTPENDRRAVLRYLRPARRWIMERSFCPQLPALPGDGSWIRRRDLGMGGRLAESWVHVLQSGGPLDVGDEPSLADRVVNEFSTMVEPPPSWPARRC